MNDPKNIALISLPYLTICSVLYNISFWDTFGLNGLLYISSSDLIKSAVQPIIFAFISSLITSFIFYYVFRFDVIFPIGSGQKTRVGQKLNTPIGQYLIIILWLIIISFIYFGDNPYRWTNWAYITSIPFWIHLYNKDFLAEQVKSQQLRAIVIQSIVLIPLFSFCTGKKESELIYKNLKYKYVINASNIDTTQKAKDTLKFIGASSQNLFFTDLKNEKILIISSSIDTLILTDKK